MRSRRRFPPPVELRLEGLSDAPDGGASERMTAFDGLPKKLRTLLDLGPFDFNPLRVADAVRIDGVSRTVWKVERSNSINRRQYARERQLALDWAREAFRLVRPKPEAPTVPPGGWTVHNFNG